MKVVLDLDKLLAQGQITQQQYDTLKSLGEQDTGNLALNILIGFGVWATALGALAWLQSAIASIQLGFIITAFGIYLKLRRGQAWGLLAGMLLLVGTLMTTGGIIAFTEGSITGFLIVTVLCLAGAILAKSGLLSALSVLALSSTIGAMTAYTHASYYLIIQQPTLTIVLFTVVGWVSYQLSKRVREDYQGIAVIFARTCLFLVNFGFWVGSLWGDSLWRERETWQLRSGYLISDDVFVIGWAIALVGVGIWAVKQQKRWVVNTLAVFGAIHFYTQFFERLGANPQSLMIAGLIALGIALFLFKYNRTPTYR